MTQQPGESIPAGEAISLVGSGALWLLDVREGFEWRSGHASLAHHIPMGELGMRQGELPDDATIAVICHSGHRSRAVTDALVAADYPAVDVAGGMIAWQASGGDVVMGGDAGDAR
ncbi:rhodanese-like domain-containing protein [Humibacter sp.]|uniref:rhodanese-like domain-containing protein n=1 Tax=Humibacter sp. TaxID=1940291 RepID=UPI002BFFCEEF|nr:rhodanese-like domain-containing protein [Humibacter sp.]HVX07151.1 rhodanese-like domain-containing protein [Humibacter sp.]